VTTQRQQPAVIPSATYRVQFSTGFTFADAAVVADYLARLGVSHLYCSPIFAAASDNSAGYDIVDYAKLDERLGGQAGYRELTTALAKAGLNQVLDIVPNHMALAGQANAWWWDVLENGPASRYASYFDIDWDPPERKLTATVLMPVLADRYGRVLEAGELQVQRDGGHFLLRYHDQELPLSPRTLDDLLASAADRTASVELKAIATELGNLPHALLTDRAAVTQRHHDSGELAARLAGLCDQQPDLARVIDAEVAELNGDPDKLDELLSRQNYWLAYWGTAAEELSYRRFFDIDSLAGLRVERPEVFDDVHRLVVQLVADGSVTGLRVDHVDGLADPEGYLTRLRSAVGAAYLVVEKILGPDEQLPGSWPVAGTSGYGFLNLVNQLFTDPAGGPELLRGYREFTGQQASFAEITHQAKLEIMREDLAAEVERLTAQLAEICERHRRQRDYTRRELRESLREVLAAFAVYRCYPRPGHEVTFADRAKVAAAVTAARQRRPDLDPELFDFIGRLLVLRDEGEPEAQFAVRFAQISAPVMAKGVEDTAFYRYQPLISLNEVGGDPAAFGASVADFHEAMTYAAVHWPDAMLTLSTHDTKRSGDVRARISVLSELPLAWNATVEAWSELNSRHKSRGGRHGRGGWPDRAAEHLLYQSLVGAWPIGQDRVTQFLLKAVREAKQHTSWTDPQPRYEAALSDFIAAILGDAEFRAAIERFLASHSIIARGRLNSLAQVALLLTCPGVPDLYAGTELWDLSLVDPDNRRPVDYERASGLLTELAEATPAAAFARDDGSSGYEPLEVTGPHADRFVAFARSGGIAVIVPRLATSTADPWTGTEVVLPAGRWASVLTGEAGSGVRASAATLLREFPVQILAREA
jgi:(1->4)-alpha-D-glucan 1-alpha-D-glucosylmutase